MARASDDSIGLADWLRHVPRGGIWLLAGVVVMLLALACKGAASWTGAGDIFIPAQLILVVIALILTGYAISLRLHETASLAATKVTGASLIRLLAFLGLVVLLFGSTYLLVSPAESARIDEALKKPSSPGGGLPDGIPRDEADNRILDANGNTPPYPWMTYTYMIALALGCLLALCVSANLLVRWAFWQEYVADEEPSGDATTITLVMLGGGVIVALLAYSSLLPAWNSGRDVLCVLSLVMLVGAMILTLPLTGRKVVASVLILLHFGGIVTAVTAVEPPGAPPPWVATKLWMVVYRPYLQFMYMNNAYHFYSPEPGPACQIWARFQYDDGSFQWVRMPSRARSAVPMTYQRVLALTESINQMSPPTGDLRLKEENRRKAELTRGIPMHPALLPNFQYREPNPYAKDLTRSYVRHLAREYATYKGQNLHRIKLYRVTHTIVTAPQLAEGFHADDPWLFMPFFQGEFDTEGNLLDPNDPLLYWLIPILVDVDPRTKEKKVRDFLPVHGGDIKNLPN